MTGRGAVCVKKGNMKPLWLPEGTLGCLRSRVEKGGAQGGGGARVRSERSAVPLVLGSGCSWNLWILKAQLRSVKPQHMGGAPPEINVSGFSKASREGSNVRLDLKYTEVGGRAVLARIIRAASLF